MQWYGIIVRKHGSAAETPYQAAPCAPPISHFTSENPLPSGIHCWENRVLELERRALGPRLCL